MHANSLTIAEKEKLLRPILFWLWTLCGMIALIVAIGGITRLTLSGLSIVEWNPVTGVIPPLTEADWVAEFEKYKAYPQYQKVFPTMELGDFKSIFFWEWFHRLIARLLGVVYLIPWVVFTWQGRIKKLGIPQLQRKLLVGFLLGGSQGLLGWLMVASGLVDRPSVSHFRLAAHFMLAVFIFLYVYRLALKLRQDQVRVEIIKRTSPPILSWIRKHSAIGLILIILQMVWGAFVAGLKAGGIFPSFPTYNGEWIPSGLISISPAWFSLIDTPIGVHFFHRSLGWVLLFYTLHLSWRGSRLEAPLVIRSQFKLLGAFVGLQFGLGVLTVLTHVAIPLAVLHQVWALVVITLLVRIRTLSASA